MRQSEERKDKHMNVRKLKVRLMEMGMNVEQLARKMNKDRSTLYRKLADPKTMTIKDAIEIKGVLNLTNDEARDIFFN